ncbi:MAG: hypothetical protein H6834_11105 [Planctomycetes bacterium]|nr:hypothetical protein [Planctomycetota bacterium]
MFLHAVALGLLTTLPYSGARCRYTVRDVGFCDLGDRGYALRVDPSNGALDLVRPLAHALFQDANVRFVEGSDGSSPLVKAPDDREHAFDLGPSPARDAALALRDLVSSPLRETLASHCLDHLCVALLVEGDDATSNTRARRAIERALRDVTTVFASMPKAVGKEPAMLTLPRDARERERWLLFSLGVDAAETEPVVAVVFGRGRRMGSTLRGDAIDAASIFRRMDWIGQSCECELDRSLMRGYPLLMEWPESLRERAVERLDFDPDSPAVIAEIRALLARGPGADRIDDASEDESLDALLLGYEEIDVGSPATGRGPDDRTSHDTVLTKPPREPDHDVPRTARPPVADEERDPYGPTLRMLGIAAGATFVLLLLVFVRGRRP